MKKQVHVFYTGRVQGVGFRFSVERIANELGIYGWVKNLDNGQVELLAEAEEDDLKDLLDEINRNFSHYIKDTEANWQPETGEFKGFGINF